MRAEVAIKKINKHAVLIGCVSFLMSFSSAMILSCAIDFSKFLGVSASIIVLGRMIGEGGGYLGRFIVGFISDIFGNRRNILLFGYGAIVFIKPMFILSCWDCLPTMQRVFIYTTANVSEKFVGSLRDPIRDAWLADYTKKEDMPINLTFRRIFSYAGTILGALCSLFLSGNITYVKLFSFALVPAFLGVGILWKFVHNSPKLQRIARSHNLIGAFFQDLKQKKSGLFVSTLFLGVFFLFLGKSNEFSLWFAGEKFGIHESNPVLFMVFYLSSCAGALLLPFLLEKISVYLILIVAGIFVIIINLLLPYFFSYWLMLLATVYYGIYGAFLDLLTTLITLQHFHDSKWKATLISLLNFTIGIAYGFAGLLNKSVIEKFGIIAPFKLSVWPVGIGIIIILGIYFFIDRNKNRV